MRLSRIRIAGVVLSLVAVFAPQSIATGKAPLRIGLPCRQEGAVSGTTLRPLVCQKRKGKLVWVLTRSTSAMSPTPKSTPSTEVTTVSQRNAVAKAASYLRFSAFSRSGLIAQLEFEGFSKADATFGVDAQRVDWTAQAVKKGASYLRTSAFSRTGLISQLEFEGFSTSEATVGADSQNADWNTQAARKAASYLRSSSFSRSGLIGQLEFEGFTRSQAEFGVASVGL